MRWWIADPERWERELVDMGRWFPEWEYREDIAEPGYPVAQGVKEKVLVRVWEGELHPLPTAPDEAVKILADLAADRVVLVDRSGVLRHDSSCTVTHAVPKPLRGRGDYGAAFLLRAQLFEPPAHPKVYSMRPRLGPELFHTQGHVNGDGSLCPFFAPDGHWSGAEGTLAKYLRAGVSILLAKHLYWQWTRDATGVGIWPGVRGPHGQFEAILESVVRSSTAQCRCGSGKPYSDCHQQVDRQLLSSASALLLNLGRR